eukprot:9485723-Pyramimonas_sp.AAC.1
MPPKKRGRPAWEEALSDGSEASSASGSAAPAAGAASWDQPDQPSSDSESEFSSSTSAETDWDAHANDDRDAEEAGQILVDRWLRLYSEGRMSAKDVCLNCYYAHMAGAAGPFAQYSMRETKDTGNYQKKLDRALRISTDVKQVQVGVPTMKNKHDRCMTDVLMTPPQEALASEFLASAELRDQCSRVETSEDWHVAYEDHPVVETAREAGETVMPVALYIDGVRYTRAIGVGRQDQFIGFFLYSLVSRKRHLICMLRKS